MKLDLHQLIGGHVQDLNGELAAIEREIASRFDRIELFKAECQECVASEERAISLLLAKRMARGTDLVLGKELLDRLESLGYRWFQFCGDCDESADNSDMGFMGQNAAPNGEWVSQELGD